MKLQSNLIFKLIICNCPISIVAVSTAYLVVAHKRHNPCSPGRLLKITVKCGSLDVEICLHDHIQLFFVQFAEGTYDEYWDILSRGGYSDAVFMFWILSHLSAT